MNLYDELMALVTALEKAEYALCGGVALAFHGYPRFTKDIDLLVRAEDLQKVREAVAACGFKIEGGRVPFRLGKPDEQIIHRVSKIQGHEALTLDLMIVNPGLEEIWRSRGMFDWKGRPVKVVSREGLVKMKRLAGRPQDLADVERLGSPEVDSGRGTADDGGRDESR